MAKKQAKTIGQATALAAAVRKRFGAASAVIPTADEKPISQVTEYVSSGIDVLDHYVLARGGYPVGKWLEVLGMEGSGKTSLGYAFLASVQRTGGTAVLLDFEQSFDEERAAIYGVNVDELLILQAEHAEEAFEQLETLLKTASGESIVGVVVDSIASMTPKSTYESNKVSDRVGALAGVMSSAMRKLNALLGPARATVMLLNQVRVKMGVMFGDNTTTPGGNAPKFYASVRLQFFGGKAIKVGANKEHVGKVVTLVAIKNRLAPPYRKARIRIDYAYGFNNPWTTLEHAKTVKAIEPREQGFRGKGVSGVDAYRAALRRTQTAA